MTTEPTTDHTVDAPALSIEVSQRISTYTPTVVSSNDWADVKDSVTVAVAASAPASPDRAQHLMLPAAKFAVWAKRQNISLDVQELFTEANIEQWVQYRVAAGSPRRSIGTERSLLRVLVPNRSAGSATLGRGKKPGPYTQAEDVQIQRGIAQQSSELYRKTGSLIYGLTRGAGLSSKALGNLRHDDLILSDTGIEVDVQGRSVWVLNDFARFVQVGLELPQSGPFVLSGKGGKRRNIGEYMSRFDKPQGTPPFTIARCRDTWILHHLRLRTPVQVIQSALGVSSLAPIEQAVKHLDPLPPDMTARLLRGE